MSLGPSDDPRYEQRAVMVIKSKAKTRAKQRKGALTNWKSLGPSDDPRYEQRAVMVIKSKAKTRAKQRKGALTNWKVHLRASARPTTLATCSAP
ncbi:putative ca2+-permeable cation channel osm-9 [Operophtera brumata]|uniref:Putative ca2+-permeable cation channel osm-9 n=1 Tax=Operophtera brumata TaxID=104452 RepID=A0A0L7LRJ3_OPEBR|nr:putative ca2+-permeable cation channel osm-9 [Operophtera brumata]